MSYVMSFSLRKVPGSWSMLSSGQGEEDEDKETVTLGSSVLLSSPPTTSRALANPPDLTPQHLLDSSPRPHLHTVHLIIRLSCLQSMADS